MKAISLAVMPSRQPPGPEALEERYEELIRSREMIGLRIGDGPDVFAQLRFRPWVYSAGQNAHSYLEELYVAPELRGNGLGRALLDAAISAARDEGATQMEVGTSEDDETTRPCTRAWASPTARADRTGR